MTTRLEIELDRESKTYFPNQHVEGKINVYVTGEVKIESILLCINGIATVLKDEQPPRIKRHLYFDKVVSLFPRQEGPDKQFPEGKSVFPFPFRVHLPKGLPSSLESVGGNVRYWVRALLDETNTLTQSVVELFSVNALLDLNRLSKATLPVSATDTKTNKCCGCLWRRWISVQLHLDRHAFVPGEFITADVDIENMSADPIISTKLSLVQVVSFRKKSHLKKQRKERRVASECVRGVVMPFEPQTWRKEKLTVPPLPCSSPPNAPILTNYFVTLEVKSSNEKMSVQVQVPVLIGCVPLTQCLDHFEDGSGDQTVPGYDWPLPNYEPCVFGPHDTTASGDDVPPEFSPCYVSYSTREPLDSGSTS